MVLHNTLKNADLKLFPDSWDGSLRLQKANHVEMHKQSNSLPKYPVICNIWLLIGRLLKRLEREKIQWKLESPTGINSLDMQWELN